MPETHRDFLPAGLRLFLLIEGVAMLVLVGVLLAVDDDTGPVLIGVIVLVMLAIQGGLLFMHAHITARQDSVTIGFWPLFRRTFRYRDLQGAKVVEVDAMRDYHGWGLKGKSRSDRGMLLGGASAHGIAISTRDGRRYVVTSRQPVEDLVAVIAARVR